MIVLRFASIRGRKLILAAFADIRWFVITRPLYWLRISMPCMGININTGVHTNFYHIHEPILIIIPVDGIEVILNLDYTHRVISIFHS